MKKNPLFEISSFLVMFLFLYTGISKLITFSTFRFDITRSPIVRHFPTFSAIALPIIEILVAICIFLPKYRKLGLYSSLLLMIIFTLYITYMLLFTPDRPCTCGGVIRQMSWPTHVFFNLAFTLISLYAVNRISSNPVSDLERKYLHQ